MRTISPKRRAALAAYREARREVETRAEGLCEARLPGCHGVGTQAHHVRRRSQGGTDTPENLLWVCGWGSATGCHAAIHAHPAESLAAGLLRSGAT